MQPNEGKHSKPKKNPKKAGKKTVTITKEQQKPKKSRTPPVIIRDKGSQKLDKVERINFSQARNITKGIRIIPATEERLEEDLKRQGFNPSLVVKIKKRGGIPMPLQRAETEIFNT